MDILQAGVGPSRKYATSSSSGATAVASFAAVVARVFVLDGGRITLSSSATNSALCTVTDGVNVVDQMYVCSGSTVPVDFGYGCPLVLPAGSSCVATLPSLGAGVVGVISLRGKYLYP